MSSRTKLVATMLPILLLLAGWWTFVWTDRTEAQAAAEDRTDQLRSDQTRIAAELASAKRFHDGGRKADEQLASRRDQLPDDTDLAGFIRQNDDLAASTGVTVESLSPEDQGTSKPDPSTPSGTVASKVGLTVYGSATAMSDYLDGLFALPRIVVVDRFDSTSTGDGTVRANLDVRIFAAKRHSAFG